MSERQVAPQRICGVVVRRYRRACIMGRRVTCVLYPLDFLPPYPVLCMQSGTEGVRDGTMLLLHCFDLGLRVLRNHGERVSLDANSRKLTHTFIFH
jgi:hypothetical protein